MKSEGPGDNFIIEQLKRVKVPVFLVVNKIDTLKRGAFRSHCVLSRCLSICRVIPISAKDKENLNEVLNVLEETLPEGPQYFPEDMITDQPRTSYHF